MTDMSKFALARTARITFITPVLGTATMDPEAYAAYLASDATPEALREELASLPQPTAMLAAHPDQNGDLLEEGAPLEEFKAPTVFHRDEHGRPIHYSYMWKGLFKEAAGHLRRVTDEKKKPLLLSGKLRAYKKIIDGLIFVHPRQVMLELPAGGQLGLLKRPLRAQGPSGERVALACSEMIPAGTTCTLTICSYSVLAEAVSVQDLLDEWLSYGEEHGMGQWRNAAYGSFTYEWLD